MTLEMEGQVNLFDLDSAFLKMCQGHSVPTGEKTSELSWKNWQGLQKQTLQYLDARSGKKRVQLSETTSLLLGELSMRNIPVFRNEDEDYAFYVTTMDTQRQIFCLLNPCEWFAIPLKTTLSQILEQNVRGGYNLSQKAAQGILNRAMKRGKVLPEILQKALMNIAYPSKSEVDAMGGAKEQ